MDDGGFHFNLFLRSDERTGWLQERGLHHMPLLAVECGGSGVPNASATTSNSSGNTETVCLQLRFVLSVLGPANGRLTK